MSDAPRREQVWRIFDNPKYSLFAARQDNMEKKPKLSIGIYEDNPRIRVRTQIPNDRNNGNIDAAFSGPGFYGFLEVLEHVAKHQGPIEMYVGLDGHPFINQQRSKDKLPVARVKAAKDQEGLITVTVTAGKNRPIIDFPFMQDEYHHFLDNTGNAMPIEMASRFTCLGWIRMIRELLGSELVKHTAKPDWMNRDNNYQGNRGNNNYQSRDRERNPGWSQDRAPQRPSQPHAPSSDYSFDDDVPI